MGGGLQGKSTWVAEAQGLLQNALGDEAASPMHWLALAQLDLDAHHVGDAVAVLREGLTHFSDDLELKLALSSALLLAGDVAGADAIVFSVSTASADEPELLLQRGMVRMRQRDFLTAQTLFRDALTAWLEAGEPLRIRTFPATGFDSERIERAMWETLMQLHDDGIQAFPTSGTLLGLTRDGGLLPFDKDWDFGLPWEQMQAAVNCLLRHGWVEYACSYGLSNPRALRQVETGLVLDLCGMTPDQTGERMLGGFWMGAAPLADDRVTVFPMLDLRKVSRGTGYVWMPVNADAWLQALYGNWREPDPDFDTVIAAHNLRDFSPLTHCYALLRIATRWQQGQRTKVLSLLRHTRKHLPDDELLLRLEQHVGRFTNVGSYG